MSDCRICDQFVFRSMKNFWADSYGRLYGHNSDIIRETFNFFMIAGLGALTKGYVLLVPKQHITSIGALPRQLFDEFNREKRVIKQALQELYGPTVFFEHGMGSQHNHGGCIEHAHLHAVPALVDFRQYFHGMLEIPIDNITDLGKYSKNGYLYFENQEGSKFVYVTDEPLPSQYFRRIWAHTLGRDNEWDWTVFINPENVASTINDLRNFFKQRYR